MLIKYHIYSTSISCPTRIWETQVPISLKPKFVSGFFSPIAWAFNSQDLDVNSPYNCFTFPCKLVMRIWCLTLMFNFNLVSLSILLTSLLDSVWILQGEITYKSLLGAKGLRRMSYLPKSVLEEINFKTIIPSVTY